MTSRADSAPGEPYDPQLRTALVLTGTGTAGAYHAGVLRALHEAGVKIDLVSGIGVGVIGALFCAIDGAARLWDEKGFWRAPAVRSFYGWKTVPRLAVYAMGASVVIVLAPLVAVAVGSVVFPIDFVLKMVGARGGGLVSAYLGVAERALAPDALPTWLPRLVVLALGLVAVAAVTAAVTGDRDRRRRAFTPWRLLRAPLSAAEPAEHCWRVMWDLVRGAAQLKQPSATELGRRYTELLSDNFGQPGFRDLVMAVHDLDTHRDLVFALVPERLRPGLFRRASSAAADERRAEVYDLAGVARDHLADVVAAALTIPVATDVHAIRFAPEAYWRGEVHRLCDRPAALGRLLDELADLGVEQAVVVTAASELAGPHALVPPRPDVRGQIGDYLQSAEASIVRDAVRAASARIGRIYVVQPAHNPLGPFDFTGGYDDRSDRRQPLAELMSRGYEDAYRQFIEPVVGASGDRVGIGLRGFQ
jgi:hypothetical protein